MNRLRITLIGGPTALIEVDGFRLLTDPTFDAPGAYQLPHVKLEKLSGPALGRETIGEVDAVLLSHDQHADNLDHSGKTFLAKARRVLTTVAGAKRLGSHAARCRHLRHAGFWIALAHPAARRCDDHRAVARRVTASMAACLPKCPRARSRPGTCSRQVRCRCGWTGMAESQQVESEASREQASRPVTSRRPRPSPPRPFRIRDAVKALGPGLITGASDDDPSGIGTYSQAGAQLGYGIGWTMLLTFPLMAAIQEISARVGRVTGHGISGNVCRHYSPWLLNVVVTLLFIANTINIARRPRRHGGRHQAADRRPQHRLRAAVRRDVGGGADLPRLQALRRRC